MTAAGELVPDVDNTGDAPDRLTEHRLLSSLHAHLRSVAPHLEPARRVHGEDENMYPPILGVDVRLTSRVTLVLFLSPNGWKTMTFHSGPLGRAISPPRDLAPRSVEIADLNIAATAAIVAELIQLLEDGVDDLVDPGRARHDHRNARRLLHRLTVKDDSR